MAKFDEIDTIRDDELGVAATITVKSTPTGYSEFSFSLFKEFQRNEKGPVERTNFLNERHIGAARRLLDQVEERIKEEKERLHRGRRSRR